VCIWCSAMPLMMERWLRCAIPPVTVLIRIGLCAFPASIVGNCGDASVAFFLEGLISVIGLVITISSSLYVAVSRMRTVSFGKAAAIAGPIVELAVAGVVKGKVLDPVCLTKTIRPLAATGPAVSLCNSSRLLPG